MMKISVITSNPSYLNDRIFSDPHSLGPKHRFNEHWIYPFRMLRAAAEKKQIELHTCDVLKPENADRLFHLDWPANKSYVQKLRELYPSKKQIVLILESPLYRKFAWHPSNLGLFDAFLSYDRTLVESIKSSRGFLFTIPCDAGPEFSPGSKRGFNERKHAVIVNTHQDFNFRAKWRVIKGAWRAGWAWGMSDLTWTISSTKELYSRRLSLAQELMSHGDEIDVYGTGWPGGISNGILESNKLETLGRYRFNVSYENCRNRFGYVSEKLIESILAGTVPVYLGEENADNWVPANAWIDARQFKNPKEIADFMRSLSQPQWQGYLDHGAAFLKSEAYLRFSAHHFSQSVIQCLQSPL